MIRRILFATATLAALTRVSLFGCGGGETILLDTKREASAGGKLPVRSTMSVSGFGDYPQFFGIQLVMETV